MKKSHMLWLLGGGAVALYLLNQQSQAQTSGGSTSISPPTGGSGSGGVQYGASHVTGIYAPGSIYYPQPSTPSY